MELYINGAKPKTNSRSKVELEKDIEVAKGSKQKAKQFNSLGNLRQILPVSMLFNSSTVLALEPGFIAINTAYIVLSIVIRNSQCCYVSNFVACLYFIRHNISTQETYFSVVS